MKKKNPNNLVNFETPEKPRAKKQIQPLKDLESFKEVLEKAKKYDELIAEIKKDKAQAIKELNDLESQRTFLKIGYVSGYKDAKASTFRTINSMLDHYLEG